MNSIVITMWSVLVHDFIDGMDDDVGSVDATITFADDQLLIGENSVEGSPASADSFSGRLHQAARQTLVRAGIVEVRSRIVSALKEKEGYNYNRWFLSVDLNIDNIYFQDEAEAMLNKTAVGQLENTAKTGAPKEIAFCAPVSFQEGKFLC